jgi:DNA-binding transcriptional MocR family regulator
VDCYVTNVASSTNRDVIGEIERRMEQPSARGLANAISRAIRDDVVAAGQRLPPIRELAHQLALSPTTVSAAWGLLNRAGAVRTDGRRGTVVAGSSAPRDGRYRRALEQEAPFSRDLSTGVPDERLLPGLGRALAAVPTAGTPRSYLDDPVLPELADHLAADWPYPPPALTIVDGAMDALELVIRSTLRFGDRVVVEHPSFPPLLDLLEAAGVEVVGVPVDEEGLQPLALEQAVGAPTRAMFLQPRAHNPTGVSMTSSRAHLLARVLGSGPATRTLVVEDDSAGAVSSSPDVSLGAALPDRTVHIRSFSKSHGPDLRLAAMSGPEELIAELRHRRQLGQGWSSRLLQRVLYHLLTDDRSRAEVSTARQVYARRREGFVGILSGHGVQVGGCDGLNVWVPVVDEAGALMRLATQGIGVAPGAPFNVLPGGPAHVRVTTGLIAEDLPRIADEVAAAARARVWSARAR